MEVRELAPALLALGEIFQEVNVLANPDGPPVSLDVRATDGGSFEIHLLLAQADGWIKQVVGLFSSDDATALANVIAYVTGAAGLFALIRSLHRRRVIRQERPEPGIVRLVFDDGTTLDVPSVVLDLYQSSRLREHARDIVKPLSQEGVDRVEIAVDNDPERVVVLKDQVTAFDVPEAPDLAIGDRETDMALTIASIAFNEGNKWRLSDGDRTFWAAVEDTDFLDRVEAGEPFRKGDILRCQLRVQQWQTEDGLKTDYSVIRVVEHLPAVRPLPLPLFPDESEPDP